MQHCSSGEEVFNGTAILAVLKASKNTYTAFFSKLKYKTPTIACFL